jgi:hypothetical protein
MIKKSIIKFPYNTTDRKAWHMLRDRIQGLDNPDVFRVGGSDIGKITGMDEYTPDIAFFYHAIGWQKFEAKQNLMMYGGRKNEPHIYHDYYQYFDPEFPTPEQMMLNESEGKIIRKATKLNCMIWNPKYEHLFANVDFLINKRKYAVQEEGAFPYHEFSNKVGVLELKDMKWETMNKYEAGVPQAYVDQLNTYIGILELEWGELFVRKDKIVPMIYPRKFNKERFEMILEEVNQFALKVIAVKQLKHAGAPSEEVEAMVHELEPPVQGTPAWTEFLKEQFKPENQKAIIEGTDEQLHDMIKYCQLVEKAEELEEPMTLIENKMKKYMLDNSAQSVSFGDLGSVNWRQKWNYKQASKGIVEKYKLKHS